MIKKTTVNRNYPKPDASNFLQDDVTQLENALDQIDTDVQDIKTTKADKTEVQSSINDLTDTLNTAKTTLQGEINTAKTTLQSEIDTAKTTLQTEINTAKSTLQTEIDTVETTLQNSINTKASQTELNTVKTSLDTLKTKVETGPPPPTLSSSNITRNSFQLSWNAEADASYYYLDVSTSSSFSSFVSGYNNKQINGTSHTVSGLQADTTYYGRVRSANYLASGTNSTVRNVRTLPAQVTRTETFNYTGRTVGWRVPTGVTSITIEAYGAQGGLNQSGYGGGRGARMRGTFAVTPGHTLTILVGQQGIRSNYPASGGGGGTFVIGYSGPMIVAGGGGGRMDNSNAGMHGVTTTYGSSRDSTDGIGGQDGRGGLGIYAGGGGGYSTDGRGTEDGSFGRHGKSYSNGGAGGNSGNGEATWGGNPSGGYGGGGGCWEHPSAGGGGGGGGYSGGDGALNPPTSGGGGGSYNAGTNKSNSNGNRSGNGLVVITYLGA